MFFHMFLPALQFRVSTVRVVLSWQSAVLAGRMASMAQGIAA